MSIPAAGTGGVSGTEVVRMIVPNPTVALFTAWKSLVEVIFRIVVMVTLLSMFIAASVAVDDVSRIDGYGDAVAAARWVVFVGVIAFIYELFFILCRLLNFAFMDIYRTPVIITDMVASAIFVPPLFAGAVSAAYFADDLKSIAPYVGEFGGQVRAAGDALGAAAFFTFMSMFLFIFLAVWMALYMILRWDIKQHTSSSSSLAELYLKHSQNI